MKPALNILLLAALLAACSTSPSPTPAGEPRTAVFAEVEYDVEARSTEADDYAPASPGQQLLVGGQARSGEEGRARLDLQPDATIVRLGPNTEFTLTGLETAPQTLWTHFNLAAGQLWIILTAGELEVETDAGTAGVRGSFLGVFYDPVVRFMTATCLEGGCYLYNDAGRTDLSGGEASDIPAPDLPPSPSRPITAKEYQTWLKYNPEAAELPSPIPAGPPDLGQASVVEPGNPWPAAPFTITYPDRQDDTTNCDGGGLLADPAADIESFTVFDGGGEVLVIDISLYSLLPEDIYDLLVSITFADWQGMAYAGTITSQGAVLTFEDGSPVYPADLLASWQLDDGRGLIRLTFTRPDQAITHLFVGVTHHQISGPNVCDNLETSIPGP